jgi:hypothetical protein
MLIKGGVKLKSYPAALFRKYVSHVLMRKAALAGLMLTAGCLAWAQSQKEFIYMGGKVIATESTQNLCTYGIDPNFGVMAAGGDSGSISVTTGNGCAWTAARSDGWITITSGGSGSGSGTVNYSAASNSGGRRTGYITIGGHPFAVIQDAAVPIPGMASMNIPGLGPVLIWDFGPEYSPGDIIEIERMGYGTFQTSEAYFIDSYYTPGATYVYRIRDLTISGAYSNYGIATTINFTNDPLAPGTLIHAQHVIELRQAIAGIRYAAGLSAPAWTDSSLAGAPIKAVHINELRSNLNQALTALQLPLPAYTDDPIVAGVTVVKAAHIQEIRNAIK